MPLKGLVLHSGVDQFDESTVQNNTDALYWFGQYVRVRFRG